MFDEIAFRLGRHECITTQEALSAAVQLSRAPTAQEIKLTNAIRVFMAHNAPDGDIQFVRDASVVSLTITAQHPSRFTSFYLGHIHPSSDAHPHATKISIHSNVVNRDTHIFYFLGHPVLDFQ